MADDNQEFVNQVIGWTEKCKAMPLEIMKETIMMMNTEIIRDTPYKTGFLARSYYASLNSPPVGAPGSGTTGIQSVVRRMKVTDTYFMGNVCAYARRVHDGFVGTDSIGRHWNIRGRFWMSRVIARFNVIAAEATRRVQARHNKRGESGTNG